MLICKSKMAIITGQVQHRLLWENISTLFLSETTESYESKFSWNVPLLVLYKTYRIWFFFCWSVVKSSLSLGIFFFLLIEFARQFFAMFECHVYKRYMKSSLSLGDYFFSWLNLHYQIKENNNNKKSLKIPKG